MKDEREVGVKDPFQTLTVDELHQEKARKLSEKRCKCCIKGRGNGEWGENCHKTVGCPVLSHSLSKSHILRAMRHRRNSIRGENGGKKNGQMFSVTGGAWKIVR